MWLRGKDAWGGKGEYGSEAWGEVAGARGDPVAKVCVGKPLAVGDFGRVETEGPGMGSGKDLDKLKIGVGAGGNLVERLKVGDLNTELLVDFAGSGVSVGFARVEVPGGGGVPFPGVGILGEGAFLKEEAVVIGVGDEDMDSAVE